MYRRSSISVVISVIFAFVLCLFLIFAFFGMPDIADALLPSGYVDDVVNNGADWWTADDYLGLSQLKSTVNSWMGNSVYDFAYLKKNPIIIAVIDSGVNIEHELFGGKYDNNGNFDSSAVDNNGVGLYDVLLRDGSGNPILKNTATSHGYKENDIADDEVRKHGTHVTGIVATLIHALDLEQYIKILPIKASYHTKTAFQEKDSFSGADVKSAVEFAISQGADVINMSLSSDSSGFAGLDKSDAYKKAVLVAAAGNDGMNVRRYPAALPNVIGVMNYTHSNDGKVVLSNSSNYGAWGNVGYDLCASGTDIYSADGEINQDDGCYGYKSLSGTSMASPVVSFGAALLAMKYKALAGDGGEEINAIELADLVRNAFSTVATCNESGNEIGVYKVFDINKLVGFATYDAHIEVSDLSLLNQRLGSLKPLNLKIDVVPASEFGKGSVEWFVDDEKIGSGLEINYTPRSEVGETTVKAVWKHITSDHGEIEQTATVKIFVDYMLITAGNVADFDFALSENGKPLESNSLNVGHTYRFDSDGLQYISKNSAKNCLWFVNGKYNHTGPHFDFTPSEAGRYEIKIKLNGFESTKIVVFVNYPNPDNELTQELKIFTIVFSTVVGAGILSVVSALIIIKHKMKNRAD